MPGFLAFFGVKLNAHGLVALNDGCKRRAEVRGAHLEFLGPLITEGMVEIVGFIARVREHQVSRIALQRVPADMPASCAKADNPSRYQPQPVGHAVFFRAVRHQLHPQAKADDGLVQRGLLLQEYIEGVRFQRHHGGAKGADARQQQHIARGQYGGIIADAAVKAHVLQAMAHGGEISRAVVNNADQQLSHRPTPTLNLGLMDPSAPISNSCGFTQERTCFQNSAGVKSR